MRDLLNFAGRTAMEEELEQFLPTALKGNKWLEYSVIRNAQQDTLPLSWIAISYVPKDSEMMDCFADSVNMVEEQAMHGG